MPLVLVFLRITLLRLSEMTKAPARRLVVMAVKLLGVLHRKQLNDLKTLATSISNSPLLQTDGVRDCIHCILDLLNRNEWATIKAKNRTELVEYSRSHQESISKIFAELERHRLSLYRAINTHSITPSGTPSTGIFENVSVTGNGDNCVGLRVIGNLPVHAIRNNMVLRDVNIQGSGNNTVGAELRLSSGCASGGSQIDVASLVGHFSNINVAGEGPTTIGASIVSRDSAADTE